MTNDQVDHRSAAASRDEDQVQMARDLMGGTAAMRQAGGRYLYKAPAESPKSYEYRKKVATLFPAYKRTVEVLVGKPMSKPITLSDDIDADIKAFTDDIDTEGRNLHVFVTDVIKSALAYGFCGILVESPEAPEGLTQEQEKALGIRPYWVKIERWQVLGWRLKRVGGMWSLAQLRFKEAVAEEDGQFGEKEVEQIRVLEPGKWRTYRKKIVQGQSTAEWVEDKRGEVRGVTEIPFVPVYGHQAALMQGNMPLIDVAYLNVEHYQSTSDQRNIVRVGRVPILKATGIVDPKWALDVGASTAVRLPPGADLSYVEHGGQSIGAGRQEIIDIEERMRQSGAELLVLAPGQVTATQVHTENEAGRCILESIALNTEDSVNKALDLTAQFRGPLLKGKPGKAKLFTDFGVATLAEASTQLVLAGVTAQVVSKETAFNEMQRRGILSPDLKYEQEKDRIEADGPPLGTMGLEGQPPQNNGGGGAGAQRPAA